MNDLLRRVRESSLIMGDVPKNGEGRGYSFDIKKAYGNPELLNDLVDGLFERMPAANCVVGYGVEGITLASVMSSRHNLSLSGVKRDFNYGKGLQIQGYEPGVGDKIIIIEDIFTDGRNLLKAAGIMKSSGAEVVRYGAIVDDERRTPYGFPSVVSLMTMEEILAINPQLTEQEQTRESLKIF